MNFSIERNRMNRALKAILLFLLNHRYFGNKHAVEKRIIISKTRFISRQEKREFEKEYREMLNQGIIIRLKKRTGKGSDWHVSLNPGKISELNRLLIENESQ